MLLQMLQPVGMATGAACALKEQCVEREEGEGVKGGGGEMEKAGGVVFLAGMGVGAEGRDGGVAFVALEGRVLRGRLDGGVASWAEVKEVSLNGKAGSLSKAAAVGGPASVLSYLLEQSRHVFRLWIALPTAGNHPTALHPHIEPETREICCQRLRWPWMCRLQPKPVPAKAPELLPFNASVLSSSRTCQFAI